MTKDLGLTHARWKVIGAIALSNAGLTVPGIARVLGQSRQAVQRITDVMVADALTKSLPYPSFKKHRTTMMGEEVKQTKVYQVVMQVG